MINNPTYIASWSGGKDSTAMIDLLLRDNKPLDYIVFCDTTIEFDEMYAYINRVKEYWEQRYNAKIVILKPKKTFKEHILHINTKGKSKGKTKGFGSTGDNFCEWRKITKITTFEKWLKKNKIINYINYIGFTTDEIQRAKNLKTEYYPLVSDYKMREVDCQAYLLKRELENPLYRLFKRTGCKFCQFQSETDWFNIFQFLPGVWGELKTLEIEVNKRENVIHKTPFYFNKEPILTAEYEKLFYKKLQQPLLFDFSDEPLKDCMCKI